MGNQAREGPGKSKQRVLHGRMNGHGLKGHTNLATLVCLAVESPMTAVSTADHPVGMAY